jgi:hypothetical protein
VMNLKDEDLVSAVALVVDAGEDVADELPADAPQATNGAVPAADPPAEPA